ncbi:MAG: PEGA domain-containing protein [Candidatus Zixiibacteriota bacterium]|nr:MAG: PEGA domain-containing protein [candidate division Zixibacteria bacterium]
MANYRLSFEDSLFCCQNYTCLPLLAAVYFRLSEGVDIELIGGEVLLKRILATAGVVVVLIVSVPALSLAQGSVTVTSAPGGAQVELKGDAVVTGITPTTFRFGLAGKYRLRVSAPGYETYKRDLLLDPAKETVVDVTLVPKTRFKAMARSLFIPGWGQYYSDQKAKGLTFTLLAAASVVGYVFADNDFDQKFAHFNDRLAAFDNAVKTGASRATLELRKQELDAAQNDAYDAENVRRIAIGSVIGVWGLSLLDALFFFPEQHGAVTVKGLTLSPDYRSQRFGFTLSASF